MQLLVGILSISLIFNSFKCGITIVSLKCFSNFDFLSQHTPYMLLFNFLYLIIKN